MRAGFAKIDITPPMGVELTGYGYYLERRCTHVVDPLYIHALAIENENGEKFLLISCDVLGMSSAAVAAVHGHAFAKYGIAPENTMLVSVHTHTGPSFKYHTGCGEVDDDYVATVPPRMTQVVDAALADLKPVSGLSFAMEKLAQPHAYNRTTPNGPVDQMVRAFFITREDSRPIALLSYACHAVCRGHSDGVSADYPGACCSMMEEKGYECMFLNGLCGDIDPLECAEEERAGAIRSFAEDVVQRAFSTPEQLPITVEGGWVKDELHLAPITREAIHAAVRKAETADNMIPGADKVARVWADEMLAKFDTLCEVEPLHVAYLILGGVPIVALPFEGFTQTGILIRQQMDEPRALTLGCAEELKGYLPTRDDIERGAYAAIESTFLYKRLPCLPGEAERLGESVGQKLKQR